MRILVIEDNHRLNSSLQMNLAHEGYSVDAAYDGQEGQGLVELTPLKFKRMTLPDQLSFYNYLELSVS